LSNLTKFYFPYRIPKGITIVDGITYCANFLQRNIINPEELLQEILESKAQFFQPRDVNYMKYRGNEIKRTKAFIYKGTDATVPIYVYPVSFLFYFYS